MALFECKKISGKGFDYYIYNYYLQSSSDNKTYTKTIPVKFKKGYAIWGKHSNTGTCKLNDVDVTDDPNITKHGTVTADTQHSKVFKVQENDVIVISVTKNSNIVQNTSLILIETNKTIDELYIANNINTNSADITRTINITDFNNGLMIGNGQCTSKLNGTTVNKGNISNDGFRYDDCLIVENTNNTDMIKAEINDTVTFTITSSVYATRPLLGVIIKI